MNSKLEPVRFAKPLRELRPLSTSREEREAGRLLREREGAAFERGRREGERALSEQLLRQRAEVIELQNGVLQSLRQLLPRMARECEGTLVTLAVEAARKLVAGLPISPEMVEATVREALDRLESSGDFTILLHADDLALLEKVNSPMLLNDVAGARLRFQPAREVTRGGCIVQTCFGTIDARRETKLELLRKSLENP